MASRSDVRKPVLQPVHQEVHGRRSGSFNFVLVVDQSGRAYGPSHRFGLFLKETRSCLDIPEHGFEQA